MGTTKGIKIATWQKRVVRETVERFESPFTAKDLCAALAESQPRVSRATVYRLLSALCLEGRVSEVSLPDGRRVCANTAETGAMCIIECSDCGRLASCVAPTLGSSLEDEARKQNLRPLHTAVYMRARCVEAGCEHRQGKVTILRTRRKSALGALSASHPEDFAED